MTNPVEAASCPTNSHFDNPRVLRSRHSVKTWRPIVSNDMAAADQPINSVHMSDAKFAQFRMPVPGAHMALRYLPYLVAIAIGQACERSRIEFLIAFFLVGGWSVPVDPSFFQSPARVLLLLLTAGWLNPFLSVTIFLLSADSIGRAFHQSRCCNRIEIRPVSIASFAIRLFDIHRAFRAQGSDHAFFVLRFCNTHR